jgi:hypothetical protein
VHRDTPFGKQGHALTIMKAWGRGLGSSDRSFPGDQMRLGRFVTATIDASMPARHSLGCLSVAKKRPYYWRNALIAMVRASASKKGRLDL